MTTFYLETRIIACQMAGAILEGSLRSLGSGCYFIIVTGLGGHRALRSLRWTLHGVTGLKGPREGTSAWAVTHYAFSIPIQGCPRGPNLGLIGGVGIAAGLTGAGLGMGVVLAGTLAVGILLPHAGFRILGGVGIAVGLTGAGLAMGAVDVLLTDTLAVGLLLPHAGVRLRNGRGTRGYASRGNITAPCGISSVRFPRGLERWEFVG
ncbi:hypothetical protein RR46_00788 [Papilio xuthus]|uniref:Uncharacterized protein n=1 Tax=Papilio xuthus TaxID=66420 RepID=A0A0N1I4X8_PAPXU|nr:hypothetical protein RR46_00788 [Papilio xuthus]